MPSAARRTTAGRSRWPRSSGCVRSSRCHFGLGHLFGRTGERDRALEHLALAAALYRDMGMSYWLANAERVRSELE